MFISYHTLIMFYIQEYQLYLQIKIQWGLPCLWGTKTGKFSLWGRERKSPQKRFDTEDEILSPAPRRLCPQTLY
jgi:hypothetical protein